MSPARRLALSLLFLAGMPVLGYAAGPIVVTQVGRAFSTRALQIKRGDVVRFVNADEFLHHVLIQSPTFNYDSGEQEPGRDVDVRFPVAGRFDVRCEIHPKMKLEVTVE